MAVDMFEDITSANFATYWQDRPDLHEPFLGEVLFPNATSPDKHIEWYRGMNRAPKPLALSAFDAQAINRKRGGYQKVSTETRLFKESYYVDEDTRQKLLVAQNSAIPAQRDIILKRVYDDVTDLVKGASLSREMMRMQVLQTGKINIFSNGQQILEDYQMKASHIVDAIGKWGTADSNPIQDLRKAIDLIGTEQGITISRVIMTTNTMRALVADPIIKATLLANNANTALATIPQSYVLAFLQSELNLTVQPYDKGYVDITNTFHSFLDDGNVICVPAQQLGETTFSPTPEQLDLAYKPGLDLSVVDTGVSIATSMTDDPVTKTTKVSQMVLPTFPLIDGVYIIHAFATTGNTGNTQVQGGTGATGSNTGEAEADKGEVADGAGTAGAGDAADTGKDGSTPPEA